MRALHPHIGARVALADGTLLGVQRAALLDGDAEEAQPTSALGSAQGARGSAQGAPDAAQAGPGPRVRDGRLLLDCSAGVLELLVVQPPGGRAMDAADYLRGHEPPGRR